MFSILNLFLLLRTRKPNRQINIWFTSTFLFSESSGNFYLICRLWKVSDCSTRTTRYRFVREGVAEMTLFSMRIIPWSQKNQTASSGKWNRTEKSTQFLFRSSLLFQFLDVCLARTWMKGLGFSLIILDPEHALLLIIEVSITPRKTFIYGF